MHVHMGVRGAGQADREAGGPGASDHDSELSP